MKTKCKSNFKWTKKKLRKNTEFSVAIFEIKENKVSISLSNATKQKHVGIELLTRLGRFVAFVESVDGVGENMQNERRQRTKWKIYIIVLLIFMQRIRIRAELSFLFLDRNLLFRRNKREKNMNENIEPMNRHKKKTSNEQKEQKLVEFRREKFVSEIQTKTHTKFDRQVAIDDTHKIEIR